MPYTPFAAGQRLPAADLDALIVSETMAWTALGSIGAYSSGMSAGTPAPRMRKLVVAGTEVWEFEGRIGLTGFTANTLTTIFTLNAGYRVGSERGFMSYATSANFYAMFLAFTSSGLIRIGNPAGSGGGTSVSLDGVWITNPLI